MRPQLVLAGLLASLLPATASSSTLTNPTQRAVRDEVVRIRESPPGPAGTFRVREDGVEVPYQVEEIGGRAWIWVVADFDPGQTRSYAVELGTPRETPPKVQVRRRGDTIELDNGLVAVRVPARAAEGAPGPVATVRLDGDRWVGGSFWRTDLPLRSFQATVVGDGTVFGKVHLRYEFEGLVGVDGDEPAFCEIGVSLGPGWRHAEILDRHAMKRGDFWELEASRGWSPREGVSRPFSKGAGSGLVGGTVEPRRKLEPGGLPYAREDLFINLFPRWNQHYKDGWCFAATDGSEFVGAVVVRASRWVWPHQNSLRAIVRPGGSYAGIRGPTWRGQRLWWLVAPTLADADTSALSRYAWESLDKLNHEMILEWPGKTGSFPSFNLYDGNQVNPTGGIRRIGRRAVADAGGDGDLDTLLRAQLLLHPDAWGSYWDYWSPENPNFFTDFMRVPIALTTDLKAHPRFDELREAALRKLEEDLYHSVTLPGGAGQECPGYVQYALRTWTEMAEACRAHLGFDPTDGERYRAAQRFLRRISQPDGATRRMLPMGDTHPAKDGGGPALVEVPMDEVRSYSTEELPGFGVIFTSRPGTPQETYLAFKSGPNRGHYHGDQLAFHYCANSRPAAVDHHCSYNPRAGQEHMHNRLAFHTDALPYANMDGYERVIAFKTSPDCDVAIGRVESERLRKVERLPPEIWHQEYPQHAFERPLVYQRSVVFVKGGPKDYFVLRDQFWSPEPLGATYCLHVRSTRVRNEKDRIDFGNLSLYCPEPSSYDLEAFPWSHDNGGGEATQGVRLTIHGDHGQFVTVLYPGPLPSVETLSGGVRVGDDEVRFEGDSPTPTDATVCVSVTRAGREILRLNGSDVHLDRSQGDVGLFVPDAGYPFGEIPDWLVGQRARTTPTR